MPFDHENLRLYHESITIVAWKTDLLASIDGVFAAKDHLSRAGDSMPVNIAMASGKVSSKERAQFSDTACGSALECAACLDVLSTVDAIEELQVAEGKRILHAVVAMLYGYRNAGRWEVREDSASYGSNGAGEASVSLDHEKLQVYRAALEFVHWCYAVRKSEWAPTWPAAILDKSSTGIVLNIAEGNGKFSTRDRCRFIGHARTAALSAAAHLDVWCARDRSASGVADSGKGQLMRIVSMLVGWSNSLE